MDDLPDDIQRVLEHIARRIEKLDSKGQPEESDRLRRVAALLRRGDFPSLTKEECDLLAEWRGANRKLGCLTEHRRLILDKWLSASRLRLSRGARGITDEQYEEWRQWLAANSAGPTTSEPVQLASGGDADLTETAAAANSPVANERPAVDGQRGADVAGGRGTDRAGRSLAGTSQEGNVRVASSSAAAEDADKQRGPEVGGDACESNIPDRITAPLEMLDPAIAELLGRIPDTWQTYRPDDLTEVQSQALFLLTATGMVERRERLRLRMAGQPVEAEATLQATGEYGIVEALEPLAAHLWSDWGEGFSAWNDGETRDASPFCCERLEPAEWRLTDQGVLARQDLAAGQSRRVFDFVLGLGFFDGRPRLLPGGRTTRRQRVRGAGSLVRMQKLQGQTVIAGTAGVGDVGAASGEAFARALCGMFEAMQAYMDTARPGSASEVGSDRKSRKQALAEKMASAREVLDEGKQEWSDLLPTRVKHAYGQYLAALPNLGDRPTDRQCYEWAKAHAEGSHLPAFETWQRYVREARRHYGQQKNAPLAGRGHGRSIVSIRDIEPPETDEAD
jgi:hypothetical protein